MPSSVTQRTSLPAPAGTGRKVVVLAMLLTQFAPPPELVRHP